MKCFRDKVVLVTAAGSGIGLACAKAYAAAGAHLHMADIRADRLEQAVQEVQAAGGAGRVWTHVLDCSDEDAVRALAEDVYGASGRVDVLQNGVGVLVGGPVEELSLEQWRRSLEVNLWSTIAAINLFLPRMLAQGGESHIVNIASFSGLVAYPFTAPYTTAKFALVGLSEALAAELYGRGIRVTLVCPGAVRTNILNDGTLTLPGGWKERIMRVFSRHAAPPDRVARQVLRAVVRRRPLLIPTSEGLPLWWLKRFSTTLYDATVRRATRLLREMDAPRHKE